MEKVVVETVVNAPINEVWRAYSNPDDIVRWNYASDDWHAPSSTVDLRPGGEFSTRMEARDGSEGFDFAGTYTNVVDQELIEYRFGERQASVEFDEVDGGVRVRVSFDPEQEFPLEQQRAGWQAILDNFRRHVETSV